MISNEQIEKRLLAVEKVWVAEVSGDGYHYELTIVSDVFIGKSLLKRQQWVYAQLKDWIQTGTIHALSMKTWTKDEWENKNG